MKEIGVEIQNARLARGIDLGEIARQTHIQLSHLEKIENGEFNFLPRPYVLAFLKTFAQHVGLNGEALAQRWREHEETAMRKEIEPAPAQKKSVEHSSPRALVSLKPKTLATTTPASIPVTIPYLKEIAIGFGMILVMAALVFVMSRAGEENVETNNSAPARGEDLSKVEEIPFNQVTQQAQQLAEPKPELPAPPAVQ
jgi:cytoskeletal protein RodZ